MYIVTMGVVNKTLAILKEEKTAEYRSGSVNVDKIVFNFSGSEWNDLTKIAVFVTESGKVIDVPLIGNYCVVPQEAYITRHTDLRNTDFYYDMVVGVYGQYIDTETNKITKILPTNLVRRKVRLGSYLPGVTPSDLPTAEQWQLYIDEVGQLASRAEASEQACIELEQAIQDIYKDIKDIKDAVIELEASANNSAQNAAIYMNSASNYANNAYNYAGSAYNYVNISQHYANESQRYSNDAYNYANSAMQYSNYSQNYMNNAKTYSESALQFANNAAQYSANALSYSNNAYNSALSASDYANNAGNYSNSASNYANSANNSANVACLCANSASSYMNMAQNYSNEAYNYSNETSATYNSVQTIYNEIWDISAAHMFAAFDVNPINGDLIMTTVQSMGNIGFSLDTNGNLVMTLN